MNGWFLRNYLTVGRYNFQKKYSKNGSAMENKKILIIDDDKALCQSLEIGLKRSGADVFIANNGQTGLQKFYESGDLSADPHGFECADHHVDERLPGARSGARAAQGGG